MALLNWNCLDTSTDSGSLVLVNLLSSQKLPVHCCWYFPNTASTFTIFWYLLIYHCLPSVILLQLDAMARSYQLINLFSTLPASWSTLDRKKKKKRVHERLTRVRWSNMCALATLNYGSTYRPRHNQTRLAIIEAICHPEQLKMPEYLLIGTCVADQCTERR